MMNHDPNLPAKSSESVRIVHIGDVVGKPGMTIVCSMIEMRSEEHTSELQSPRYIA
jgi:hypothetical protein